MAHIIEMNSILLSNKRIRNANCFQISMIEYILSGKLDEYACVILSILKMLWDVLKLLGFSLKST